MRSRRTSLSDSTSNQRKIHYLFLFINIFLYCYILRGQSVQNLLKIGLTEFTISVKKGEEMNGGKRRKDLFGRSEPAKSATASSCSAGTGISPPAAWGRGNNGL